MADTKASIGPPPLPLIIIALPATLKVISILSEDMPELSSADDNE